MGNSAEQHNQRRNRNDSFRFGLCSAQKQFSCLPEFTAKKPLTQEKKTLQQILLERASSIDRKTDFPKPKKSILDKPIVKGMSMHDVKGALGLAEHLLTTVMIVETSQPISVAPLEETHQAAEDMDLSTVLRQRKKQQSSAKKAKNEIKNSTFNYLLERFEQSHTESSPDAKRPWRQANQSNFSSGEKENREENANRKQGQTINAIIHHPLASKPIKQVNVVTAKYLLEEQPFSGQSPFKTDISANRFNHLLAPVNSASSQGSSEKKRPFDGFNHVKQSGNPTFNITEGHVFSFQKELVKDKLAAHRNNQSKIRDALLEKNSRCSRESGDAVGSRFEQINASLHNRQEVESFDQDQHVPPVMEQDEESMADSLQTNKQSDAYEEPTRILPKPQLFMMTKESRQQTRAKEVQIDLSKRRDSTPSFVTEKRETAIVSKAPFRHESLDNRQDNGPQSKLLSRMIPELDQLSTKKKPNDDFLKQQAQSTLEKLNTQKLSQQPSQRRFSALEPSTSDLIKPKAEPFEFHSSLKKAAMADKQSFSKNYIDLMASKRTLASESMNKNMQGSAVKTALQNVNSAAILDRLKAKDKEPAVPKQSEPSSIKKPTDFQSPTTSAFKREEEDSHDLNLYENILGDLRRGSSKKLLTNPSEMSTEVASYGRDSLKRGQLGSHQQSSKDSSKMNVKINVGNLAKRMSSKAIH